MFNHSVLVCFKDVDERIIEGIIGESKGIIGKIQKHCRIE